MAPNASDVAVASKGRQVFDGSGLLVNWGTFSGEACRRLASHLPPPLFELARRNAADRQRSRQSLTTLLPGYGMIHKFFNANGVQLPTSTPIGIYGPSMAVCTRP